MPSGLQLRRIKESAAAVTSLEGVDVTEIADAATVASDLADLTARVDAASALVHLTDNSGGATGNNTVAVIPVPTDSPASADALRDDLTTNVLPPIRDAIADLTAKVNALLTALA